MSVGAIRPIFEHSYVSKATNATCDELEAAHDNTMQLAAYFSEKENSLENAEDRSLEKRRGVRVLFANGNKRTNRCE
jgi:hypothetical protein